MSEDHEDQRQLNDFSQLVKEKIPEYTAPVKDQPALLNDALEKLLALEKKTRLAADVPSTKEVALAILNLCHECKQWPTLIEHVSLLCKRRAQLKKVQQTVIQTASSWVDSTPSSAIKRELLVALRGVSEGKLFVELERARLTRQLAALDESEGKISDAANVLQEVQVETIGSMEVKEKADFLLEQIRLLLARKDHIRADIVQKKVNPKILQKEDMQDLKLKYYNLMIEFYSHSSDYLATCKAYRSIFDTPKVQQDEAAWKDALTRAVMFVTLSPFDSEVSDLLHRIKAEKKLDELPSCMSMLTLLTTDELINWPLPFEAEWSQHAVFTQPEIGAQRLTMLRKRIVQHNMRTIAAYYHRITSKRYAELLGLSADESEQLLSELVSSKQLFAKIDRPSGIITFTRRESPNAILNNWASDINQLLGLVETTCHLISKENMVHKMKA